MDSGIQPVMNVGGGYGYGNGFGGGFMGEGIWLFAILALMWGGFGGNRFGNAIDGRCATVEDLNNSQNFARLENQVQGIGSAIAQQNTNLSNAICTIGYQNAVDFGSVKEQLSNCCCRTEREILENRYLSSQNTAAINANTTAQIQKVLDTLCQDKISAQAAKIQQLELNQALCGVLRYPTTTTYSAGFPFNGFYGNNGCGCGCNGGF